MPNDSNLKQYDLETRTTQFSRKLINFCRNYRRDIITIPLITQVIRSRTSIGANYREANGASSKKDFQHKIFLCKKESKETMYWLELLGNADDNKNPQKELNQLWQESKELTLIFGKIVYSIGKTTSNFKL